MFPEQQIPKNSTKTFLNKFIVKYIHQIDLQRQQHQYEQNSPARDTPSRCFSPIWRIHLYHPRPAKPIRIAFLGITNTPMGSEQPCLVMWILVLTYFCVSLQPYVCLTPFKIVCRPSDYLSPFVRVSDLIEERWEIKLNKRLFPLMFWRIYSNRYTRGIVRKVT